MKRCLNRFGKRGGCWRRSLGETGVEGLGEEKTLAEPVAHREKERRGEKALAAEGRQWPPSDVLYGTEDGAASRTLQE